MNHYTAEIISIGNEVLAGYTVNTNASYISRQLSQIGLPVKWVTTIADEHDEILHALQTANRRADAVLVTGGLGPTPDDITKLSISEYFDRPLIDDAKVLQDVESFLHQRGRSMSEANRLQARIPQSDKVMYNWAGTAPGLILKKDSTIYFFMPGVPLEMKALIESYVLDYLKNELDLPELHTQLLRTTGIAESRLYEIIEPVLKDNTEFPFSFLPRQIGVDLRTRYLGREKAHLKKFENFVKQIRRLIEPYIMSEQDEELEQVLGRILSEKKMTVSTAESFTGGLLSDLLTNIPGSSDYFLGGCVTYSNQSKEKLLDVQEATLQNHGAVSEETAIEMVQGVQIRFSSDCAIATTGVAGPGGGSDEKPVGLAYVAAIHKDQLNCRKFRFGNNRRINKMRGAVAGMEMLRRLILKINK